MLYAILADIHGNLVAFEAVLQDMKSYGEIEQIWCLGDIVGYGPAPHQCIELLRQFNHLAIVGNHEWAAIGRIDTFDFNPESAAAIHWTMEQLTREDKEYLEALPLTLVHDSFTLAHGSPRSPLWEYLLDSASAGASFAYANTQNCFIGHSHLPLIFRYDEAEQICHRSRWESGSATGLGRDRLIINPGSVGQPRDGDPRAGYAIYDSKARRVVFIRIAYDITTTQREMERYDLPRHLINRLALGR